jgi:hypothetical protein
MLLGSMQGLRSDANGSFFLGCTENLDEFEAPEPLINDLLLLLVVGNHTSLNNRLIPVSEQR